MGMPPSFGRMQMLLLVTLLLVVVPLSIHSGTGSSPLVSAFTQSYLNPQRHAFSLLCTARKNEAKRSTSSYCFGTSFRRRHLTSLNSYSEVSDTQEEEKQSEKIPTTSSKGWSSTLSDQKNSFARAAATAAVSVALLTATLLPQSANAGFGPSGGATTSQTPLQSVKENAVESLSFDKLTQLIDSNMRGAGLSSLADQINSLVETLTLQEQQEEQDLQNFQMEPDTSKYMSVEEYKEKEQERLKQERERLQKARTLQQQIVKRTSMLEKLEAQPVWFNYFAAFIGSVVSTSIMHPVDTIKTRIMMNSGEDELDFDELVNWNSSMIENVTESSYDMTPTYDRVDDSGVATLVATNTTTKTLTDHHTQHHLSTFTSTSTESTHSLIELKDTVLNLYEGLPGNILKEGPASALYLGVYEIVKVKLLTTTGIGSAVGASDAVGPLLLIYLTAGAAGETIGSTVCFVQREYYTMLQIRFFKSLYLYHFFAWSYMHRFEHRLKHSSLWFRLVWNRLCHWQLSGCLELRKEEPILSKHGLHPSAAMYPLALFNWPFLN